MKKDVFSRSVKAEVYADNRPEYPSYTIMVPLPPKDLLRIHFWDVFEDGRPGAIETSNFVRLETLPNHIQRLVADHIEEIRAGHDKVALESVLSVLPQQTVTPSEEPVDLSEYIPKE